MNSSQFKKSQLKYLAKIINSTPKEITTVLNNIDDYYSERIEKKTDSNTGNIKTYSDGTAKTRIVRPPAKRLKELQKNIKNNILAKVQLPENIHGGVKGKANYTNAKEHKGKKYKFCTDLKDFYPTITNDMVYKKIISLGYSTHISSWLTKLTTWKYELPQGAPTSTHLANIIFLDIDEQLINLCNKSNITYTRYVDDLTFSSNSDFKELLNQILEIITKSEFKISYRKTSYKGTQNITGIILRHNYLVVPDWIRIKAQKEEGSLLKPYTSYIDNIKRVN